jgi:prepilin-type N-terminal cleavage/methylation domain-containing protein
MLIVKTGLGFTMVELLVTLVLLGLISAMVAPGLESWLAARKASAVRMEINSQLALLPLQANRSGQQIVVDSAEKLDLIDIDIKFTQPIVVNANGFCQGGQFQLQHDNSVSTFDVLAPYCEVKRATKN